jgi:hypothetical protein
VNVTPPVVCPAVSDTSVLGEIVSGWDFTTTDAEYTTMVPRVSFTLADTE